MKSTQRYFGEKVVGYKIWNHKTGLFSKGGSVPQWNKIGKTWSTLNALRNHFAVIREYGYYAEQELKRLGAPVSTDKDWRVKEVYPPDCRIVTLVESEVHTIENYL